MCIRDRDEVLPPSVTARISIEAGSTLGWSKYVGPSGISIGVDTFGASAPLDVLFEEYGLTSSRIKLEIERLIGQS